MELNMASRSVLGCGNGRGLSLFLADGIAIIRRGGIFWRPLTPRLWRIAFGASKHRFLWRRRLAAAAYGFISSLYQHRTSNYCIRADDNRRKPSLKHLKISEAEMATRLAARGRRPGEGFSRDAVKHARWHSSCARSVKNAGCAARLSLLQCAAVCSASRPPFCEHPAYSFISACNTHAFLR